MKTTFRCGNRAETCISRCVCCSVHLLACKLLAISLWRSWLRTMPHCYATVTGFMLRHLGCLLITRVFDRDKAVVFVNGRSRLRQPLSVGANIAALISCPPERSRRLEGRTDQIYRWSHARFVVTRRAHSIYCLFAPVTSVLVLAHFLFVVHRAFNAAPERLQHWR